nr:inactive protein tyrosine kinase pTKL-like isoform X2 [Scatophagus argus]XP_046237416.1 inactive protein tyrosine kinase pTKL-like isoform X2 [Scatophagus argus]XP_046237417.1 inactive protein tyrosine kinase pTKL-like isoform X2 [Scatophagus argus]
MTSPPPTDTRLLSSSSSPSPPRHSLQSAELQAEFLQEYRKKILSRRDISESSVSSSPASPSCSPSPLSSPASPSCSPSPLSSPASPSCSPSPLSSPSSPGPSTSSSSSPCYNSRQARLSLSSPELLSELKDSRTRSLRHVPKHNGLTTVFSGRGRGGRGRQASGPTPSTQPANQRTSS